jgi:hypothetical protein
MIKDMDEKGTTIKGTTIKETTIKGTTIKGTTINDPKENCLINDVRDSFKNITFSKFQKSKARYELIKSLCDEKIENACYWSAEFICSGHYLELWDIILYFVYKYIHNGNPKLAIYLNMRYNNFETLINNGYSQNILVLRNNDKIRRLFCEIICVLCYSLKKNVICEIKLDKQESFDIASMSERFKAPNVSYIEYILKDDDPKELIIPINELVYNLINKNIINVYYWLEWIIEYENICKKKKKKCACENRSFAPKGSSHDIIWIIWDILLYYSDPSLTTRTYNIHNNNNNNNNNNEIKYKIIKSLLELFVIKYSNNVKKKRKYIMYFAFALLIEHNPLNSALITHPEKIEAIVSKIDNVYKDIKKNEVSPKTDYLFTNLNKSNIEKTIEKIELINSL